MANVKMVWCLKNINDKKQPVYIENMEKDTYEQEYKGKLTCIHGCDARIKFTERKNGIKFYSTWNNEGDKHSEDCEFHVKYKGKVGRKRLMSDEEKRQITEDQIKNAIERKIKNLKYKFIEVNGGKDNQGTNSIENTGVERAKVSSGEGESQDLNLKRENVTSIESSLVNSTYIDRRKCVYGDINNVQYDYSEGNELYGYLNLQNEHYKVSVYFPPAFYNNEDINEDELKRLLDILKEEINVKEKKAMVVCFGKITFKKKKHNEFNINVINPLHIKINEMSIKEILITKSIKEINYEVR
ncbi:hypothetical protein [Clostridium beijerinckii]|uniref:hypothetical protein n=1 Tax=Clostridium beijerinckii TaxID=1520 RepID=UPI001F3A16BE|nr:hypothetical protein [Clostridium beijerinckii]